MADMQGPVGVVKFAERSGVVLIVAPGSRYFWLDLRTKEIFRWLQLFLGLPL